MSSFEARPSGLAPLDDGEADDAGKKTPLSIKPEMHDVAVGDDIFLAFQPQLAGITGARLAAERDVIGVGDRFGADKALFEIGMNNPYGGGRLCAAVDGPGPRPPGADGEIGDEVEQRSSRPDYADRTG